MIPLNKPYLCQNANKGKQVVPEVFISEFYKLSSAKLVFSARQGLEFIYNELYNKYGSCIVAVSPLTCFEALYPIINNHHIISFVDIDPETLNMDENLIPDNVKVIQAIHLGGNPQRMDKLKDKAQEFSCILVEDCAQALGSKYNGVLLGSFGNYASFSLMKNVFALGGGFILKDSDLQLIDLPEVGVQVSLYRNLKRYIESHLSTNDIFWTQLFNLLLKMKPESTSTVFSEYSINNKIYNSISSQLICYDYLINKRIKIAEEILQNINNPVFEAQKVVENGSANYCRLIFKLNSGNTHEYIRKFRKKNIGANHLTQNARSTFQESIFDNPSFKKYARKDNLINYSNFHDKTISLPISPALKQSEITYLIQSINSI